MLSSPWNAVRSCGQKLFRTRIPNIALLVLVAATCRDATSPELRRGGGLASAVLPMYPTSATVQVGATVKVTAWVGSPPRQVTWSSSSPHVASVVSQTQNTSRVTGVGPGTTTIIAVAGADTGRMTITVPGTVAAVRSVVIAPDSTALQPGDSTTFAVVLRDANGNTLTGRTVTWSVSDTGTASVSTAGTASARRRGVTRVLATSEAVTDTATLVVRQAQLTVASLSAKDTVTTSDWFMVNFSIQNVWDSPSADSVILRVGYRDSSGTVLGAVRKALPRVIGGATVQDSVMLTMESIVPGRDYSVVAYVDCRDLPGGSDSTALSACLANAMAAGSIAEGNETDNSRTETVFVRRPNLLAYFAGGAYDTVISRSRQTRQVVIHNSGSATAVPFTFIAGVWDGSTIRAATAAVAPPLGTRRTDTLSISIELPALDAGGYQILVAVDCPPGDDPATALRGCVMTPAVNSAIPEWNEQDNLGAVTIVVISGIARIVSPDSITFTAIGDTTRLASAAFDSEGQVIPEARITYQSLNPGIVSVTGSLLRAVGAGTAQVVASGEGRADTTRVSVVQQPARLIAGPATIWLYALNDTARFTATVTDRNGNSIPGAAVSWSSLDPDIATIVAPGIAVSHARGDARIVAASGAVADTVGLTVTQRLSRIQVTPDSAFLAPGDTLRLTATAYDARNSVMSTPLTWQALDPAGATVDSTGLVTAVSAWLNARILVHAPDNGIIRDSAVITVSDGGVPPTPNPVPVVSDYSPLSFEYNVTPPPLTVRGSGFVAGSVVRINGVARPTEVISATELRATLSAADVATVAELEFTVFNPAPNGGISGPWYMSVTSPTPSIAGLTPPSAVAGSGDVVVSITGSNFLAEAQVMDNHQPVPSTFVSSAEIRVTLTAASLALPGFRALYVANPWPGAPLTGHTSNWAYFNVTPVPPVIASLSPSQAAAGAQQLTVRVTGSGFYSTSRLRFNGVDRVTTFIDSSTLEMILGEADLRVAGSYPVTVATPASTIEDYGAVVLSNAVQLVLVNGAPTTVLLPSAGARAGSAGFTLTLHGSGFVQGAQVHFNGSARPTQYVSGSRVTAQISASDVATSGTAQVTVVNPAPGGGSSAPLPFTIRSLGSAVTTSLNRLQLEARDLAYVPSSARLYLSIPDAASAYTNRVMAIDPVSATGTGDVYAGSDPSRLAASDDGQYLYVGLNRGRGVSRIRLSSLTQDLEWSLASNQIAADIQVVPGSPGSVAVSRQWAGTSQPTFAVTVYDNGVARGQSNLVSYPGNHLAFLGSPNVLYGFDNSYGFLRFQTMAIDATGVRNVSTTNGLISGATTTIVGAAGRIYGSDGSIVDAERRVRIGALSGSSNALLVEPSLGRAYALTASGITVYDLNTYENLGTLPIPDIYFGDKTHHRLVRWGVDGLAFLDHNELFIVRSPIFAP